MQILIFFRPMHFYLFMRTFFVNKIIIYLNNETDMQAENVFRMREIDRVAMK